MPPGDQILFCFLAKAFDLVFDARRSSAIAHGLYELQPQWPLTAQVPGASRTVFMLLDTPGDVDSDACIQAAIPAADDVQAVFAVGHDQALPPVSVSPRTRNAPASMLAPFSGVSAKVSAI